MQYSGMTGAQIERARTKERMDKLAKLSREDYREWKSKLQSLSLERLSIKEAMGFAFDKIECSEEVPTYLPSCSSCCCWHYMYNTPHL